MTITALTVSDRLLARVGMALSCPTSTLAPRQSVTCRSDRYTVTRGQARRGVVENFATAAGKTRLGLAVKSAGTVTRLTVVTSSAKGPLKKPLKKPRAVRRAPLASPKPTVGLAIQHWVSAVKDQNKNGVLDPGDTVDYSFRVGNSGSVIVHQVQVHDKRLEAARVAIHCSASQLAPGQSVVCVSDPWKVTRYQAKHDLGQNYAFATGLSPKGTAVRSRPSLSVHGTSALPTRPPRSGCWP